MARTSEVKPAPVLPEPVDLPSAEAERVTRETRGLLAAQPTRRIRLWQVPENSTDRQLPDEEVYVNGHSYLIKRGETVEVPETVAEILEQAGRF